MPVQSLETQMGLDVSQYIAGAQKQIQAMGGQTAGIEKLIGVSERFNASQKLVSSTAKAVANEIQTVTAKIVELTKKQQEALAAGQQVAGHIPGTTRRVKETTIKTDLSKQLSPENVAAATGANEQLRQFFPVPAKATIDQLAKYESALGRVQKLLSEGKVSSARFTQIFDAVKSGSLSKLNLSGDEQKLVTALGQVGNAFKAADSEIGKFHLTLRNAFRITEALLLKEVISALVFQLQRAAIEAVQFQITLSQIRTLSTENQASFNSWSESIQRVSDALGLPQIEVAKAAYEALSAQIVEGRQQTEAFLKTAGDLARVGVADIGDSVKLLQAVFNSYNLSVERADEISAKLFVGVDRGNFTVKDLAGNFGRVSSTAAAMNVRFEETLAALTTLTRQGVSSADAQTQLLNIFLKLQNPTQATSKFLKSMGFETGQAAVQALGFIGVLREIEKATKGDISTLADFGGELRAIRGLIGLTTRGKGGEFEQDLAEIEGKARDKFAQARAIRGESAGDQLTIELNKVKNFFTNDFGQSALNTLNEISKSFGGLNNTVQATVKSITVLVKVVATYFVASKATNLAQSAFNASLDAFNHGSGLESAKTLEKNAEKAAALGRILKGIGAAAAFAVALDEFAKLRRELDGVNKKSEEYENTLKRIQSLRQGKTESGEAVGHKLFTQSALDQSTAFSGFVDKLFQPLLQKEAQAAQAANQTLETLREEGKETALQLTESFKKTSDSVGNLIKRYEEGFRRADTAINNSKKSVLSMKETVESLIFDLKFEFADSAQKFILRDQEIGRLRDEAQKLLSSGNDEDIEKGRDVAKQVLQKVQEDARERVRFQVEQERQRRQQSSTRGFVDNSPIFAHTQEQQDRLRAFAEHFANLELDVQRRKKEEQDLNEKAVLQEKERLRLLQKRVELFNQLKPSDEAGKIKPEFTDPGTGKFAPDKFIKDFDARSKAVTDLLITEEEKATILPQLEKARLNLLKQQTAELALQKIQSDQLKLGSIRDTSKEEFEKASKQRIQASQTAENASTELRVASEIARGFVDRARSDSKFSTIGEGEDRFTRFSQQLTALVYQAENNIRRATGGREVTPSQREAIAKQNEGLIKGILETQEEVDKQRNILLQRDAKGNLINNPQAQERLRLLSETLVQKLDLFVGQFTGKKDNSDFAVPGGATIGELKNQVTNAMKLFDEARQQENDAIRIQKNLEEQLSRIFTPAQLAAAKQTVATDTLTNATLRAATATQNLVNEFQRLPTLLPPAPPANIPVMPQGPGFHTGGLIKGPKGYDNLLIRAEAGEFVMNEKSTKKWLPQLIAMNNGMSPKIAGKYHEGGLVQTNVGDVNVTITGPISPERNVKQIGKALRREIRRGNLNLEQRK